MNVIWQLLSNAGGKWCLIHFSLSLWWKISLYLIFENVTIESNTYKCAFLLFALLFVSLEDVNEIFGYIVEIEEKKLDDLMDHVVTVHVHGRLGRGIRPQVLRFPPETWNIFISALNSNHRTNNTVEGCHSKFQKLMVIHHPSIWRFFLFFFFKC